jgi:hypothetical protein
MKLEVEEAALRPFLPTTGARTPAANWIEAIDAILLEVSRRASSGVSTGSGRT